MVFDLTSEVREVLKPVQESSAELLQEIPRSMVEYTSCKTQEIECRSKETSLEAVMFDIMDKYVRISNAMGPAKSNQQIEMKHDDKDSKKKVDKPATANPAINYNSRVTCQKNLWMQT